MGFTQLGDSENIFEKLSVILIAGDATTVTKSGKKTFGLGRFFSSIYSRTVPGVAFQTLSLIDVEKRISWPMLIEQMLPKPKQKKLVAVKSKKSNTAKLTQIAPLLEFQAIVLGQIHRLAASTAADVVKNFSQNAKSRKID